MKKQIDRIIDESLNSVKPDKRVLDKAAEYMRQREPAKKRVSLYKLIPAVAVCLVMLFTGAYLFKLNFSNVAIGNRSFDLSTLETESYSTIEECDQAIGADLVHYDGTLQECTAYFKDGSFVCVKESYIAENDEEIIEWIVCSDSELKYINDISYYWKPFDDEGWEQYTDESSGIMVVYKQNADKYMAKAEYNGYTYCIESETDDLAWFLTQIENIF